MRWSEEEYQAFVAKKYKTPVPGKSQSKKNKYHAVKTWRDGICFDSIKEADYYSELKLRHAAGEIAGYIVHGKMVCTAGGDSPSQRATTYEPDFIVLYDDGTYEIVDTKSEATITPVFRLKIKALREKFPLVKIKIQG